MDGWWLKVKLLTVDYVKDERVLKGNDETIGCITCNR